MSFLEESRPIILAAGGTGGHIYPAISVARALIKRTRNIAIITDDRGTLFSQYDLNTDIYYIKASSPSGGLLRKLIGLGLLGVGFFQARSILKKIQAVAVIGFGGYPSVPTMCAAAQIGLPTIIHEQNAVMGRANRFLAPTVKKIAVSYDQVKGISPKAISKVIQTGNPVREEISKIGDKVYTALDSKGKLNVLVFGGSQGAQILSKVVPSAIAALPKNKRSRVVVTQQCHPGDMDFVKSLYKTANIQSDLRPYFNDMPDRLSAASLVISRAGASTISELVAAKRPAILVPYPHATDDHQTANAVAITSSSAGWCISEDKFTIERLKLKIQQLIENPSLLNDAADNIKDLYKFNAAETLADILENTINQRANSGVVA